MRYIYFNRNKKVANHDGIICVGYEYSENNTELNLAVTFCAPGDVFNKKTKVHDKLPGRLAKNKCLKIVGIKPNMKYEEVTALVKSILNKAIPKGYTNVKDYVKAHNYKKYPEFAGVRLPFWFKGVN
jgi:hypothetical protein